MNFLFYIRREIDFDFMLPLLHKLSANPDNRLHLYSSLDTDFRHDTWLKLLSKRNNVYSESIYSHTILKRHMGWMANDFLQAILKIAPRFKLLRSVINRLTPPCNNKWANALLSCLDIDRVVMAPNKLTRGLTGVLVPAARQKGIPVYSVSNSIDIVLLGAEGYKDVDPGQLDHFDRQIVVNNYRRTYLERTGHDLNRIVVAGSPRSCVEWTKFRRQTNAIQPVEVEDSEGRLKILVFGRTPEPCLTDDYIATLNKIAELDFVKIVLKLKPQSDFTASYLTELDKNIVLRSDRDTFQFSLWADVALGITTTALIEPMMLNIPIIDLGHLRVLPTNYASAGACWSSNSASHLVDLLHKLHSEYPPSSYPWDIVESYLQENVVAEAPNGDVLGYHEKLLVTDPATVQ